MASRQEWAIAYAEQSASDWNVFQKLTADGNVEFCHALHYLQMACEKIAKAYRFRDTDTAVGTLLTSHVAVSKFIETFLCSPIMMERWTANPHQLRPLRQRCRQLAREVEIMAPAVARTGRPENAEYPWESGKRVQIPASYSYPNLSQLQNQKQTRAIEFLKVIRLAIDNFA